MFKGIFKEYSKSASTTSWVWSSHLTIHAFNFEFNVNLSKYLSSEISHLGTFTLILGAITYSVSEQSNYLDWSLLYVPLPRPLIHLNLPSLLIFFKPFISNLSLLTDFEVFNSLLSINTKTFLDLRYTCFSFTQLGLFLTTLSYSVSNLNTAFTYTTQLTTYLKLASNTSLAWSIYPVLSSN